MSENCTDFGRTVPVETIRRFASTKMTCGVGFDDHSWFVYDRHDGEPWHKHCGPYSTRVQGVDWINDISERRN